MNIFNDVLSIIIGIAKDLGIEEKDILDRITAEPPKNKEHGDISTNFALIVSKKLKKNPFKVAEEVKEILSKIDFVSKIQIAGPGFINLFLKDFIWHNFCHKALVNKNSYGRNNIGNKKQTNIEFVSANPTGPLHIGHARGAVFGDSLANIMEFSGYDVTREYYINDAGEQINFLARSVYARYIEILIEKKFDYGTDLYPGEYLIPIAEEIIKKYGRKFIDCEESEWINIFKETSINYLLLDIKEDLARIRITHDSFVSENSIIKSGKIQKTIEHLKKNNLLYNGRLDPPKGILKEDWESRDQLLFRSTNYGDDLDRPLTKSDGSWTYFATDAAYHYEKCEKKYDILINVWGADHGGYIKRIEGIVNASSNSKVDFNVSLCQLVNVVKNGIQVKMSKRKGDFVTLREVIEIVGPDVLRFIMLTRKNDASLDFDLESVTKQSKENPVYYVQYAHARIRSLFKKAANEKIDKIDFDKDVDFNLLNHPSEINLMKLVSTWPRIVELSAKSHEPHRVTYFLTEIASEFHHLWSLGNTQPEMRYIISNEIKLTKTRLALAESIRIVISLGLLLIGVKPLEELK